MLRPRRRLFVALLAVAALLGGCAPLVSGLGEAVRAPALHNDAAIMADGTVLPLRLWLPEADPPRAAIVALHGFNDYSNAFDAAARAWAQDGIATFAYDQRGFGAHTDRGLWPGGVALADDLRSVIALLASRYPGVPLYALGESMGAAVVVLALAEAPETPVTGTILAAPAVRSWHDLNPLSRGLLWLAAHSVPWWSSSGRGLGIQASDNIEMLRALARDPLVVHSTRLDALYGLVELMDAADLAAPQLTVSSLVLYGARDELVAAEPVMALAARLGDTARLALYPKGYHLLLRDLQAETVIADIAAWIGDPSAPLPSGAECNAHIAADARAEP